MLFGPLEKCSKNNLERVSGLFRDTFWTPGPPALQRTWRFEQWLGGRKLATSRAQSTARIVPQNCVLLPIRGAYKKGAEKRPASLLGPTTFVCQACFEPLMTASSSSPPPILAFEFRGRDHIKNLIILGRGRRPLPAPILLP